MAPTGQAIQVTVSAGTRASTGFGIVTPVA